LFASIIFVILQICYKLQTLKRIKLVLNFKIKD
jgi:hypothetical protein